MPNRAQRWTVEGDLDCWVWSGYTDANGTPRIRTKEGNETARRVIWKREIGPIPEGKMLYPMCGNRGCVRPRHMDPVTRRELAYKTCQSRLDRIAVKRAVALRMSGHSVRYIAEMFDVSERTIRRVLDGEYWMPERRKTRARTS